jgi:hypothetical protein
MVKTKYDSTTVNVVMEHWQTRDFQSDGTGEHHSE